MSNTSNSNPKKKMSNGVRWLLVIGGITIVITEILARYTQLTDLQHGIGTGIGIGLMLLALMQSRKHA